MVNDIISPSMFSYPETTYIKGVKYVLKYFKQTANGYEAVYEESSSKGTMTPDEAWKIIESSNISKENKALLKEYIYKEG